MLARLVNGLSAVAGAAAAAQFPSFYAQYVQHISGRLSQARADLAPVMRDAAERKLEIAAYLEQARREGGELTRTLVEGYEMAFDTLSRLEGAYTALREAGVFERPLVFARHFHGEVAQGTLRDFAPALPLTAEGMSYAAVGLILGIGAAWGLEGLWRAMLRRWRRARATPQSKGHERA